ncbi:helix-turn-helix domain-containing protein [Thomasclavelia cocleata]|uniref:helix-turn-helix domain-containing protein n=1 Tax=Thomasclavelia cocleata TaxID=69824 RepID=UPI00242D6A16|nr:helix-turn-helix transcriptional regulator [Thomasclavelia cocleata]
MEKYGHIELRIEELLKERNISKNKVCKDLDLSRPNFNKYCRNQFQRIDANLIAKLCFYLNCEIQELIIYVD